MRERASWCVLINLTANRTTQERQDRYANRTQTTCQVCRIYCWHRRNNPLACGNIGHTDYYDNERLREHERSVTAGTSWHLAKHCNISTCQALLKKTVTLKQSQDIIAQELRKVFFIKPLGSECVSVASIALYNTELCSMKSFV